jgi:hypothetical protein
MNRTGSNEIFINNQFKVENISSDNNEKPDNMIQLHSEAWV